MHPTREILYVVTCRGVAAYDLQQTDKSRRIQHLNIEDGGLESQSLQFSTSFDALFLSTRDGLLRMETNGVSGFLQAPGLIISVPHAQSVVFI
jgi:hypothetical protein